MNTLLAVLFAIGAVLTGCLATAVFSLLAVALVVFVVGALIWFLTFATYNSIVK